MIALILCALAALWLAALLVGLGLCRTASRPYPKDFS